MCKSNPPHCSQSMYKTRFFQWYMWAERGLFARHKPSDSCNVSNSIKYCHQISLPSLSFRTFQSDMVFLTNFIIWQASTKIRRSSLRGHRDVESRLADYLVKVVLPVISTWTGETLDHRMWRKPPLHQLREIWLMHSFVKLPLSSAVRPATRKYPQGTFQLELTDTAIKTRASIASGTESLSLMPVPRSTKPRWRLPSHSTCFRMNISSSISEQTNSWPSLFAANTLAFIAVNAFCVEPGSPLTELHHLRMTETCGSPKSKLSST